MITFKQQFDKLTRAYIDGQVDPYAECACFVGNLLNGNGDWACVRYYKSGGKSTMYTFRDQTRSLALYAISEESEGFYNGADIVNLENLFLKTLEDNVTVGETLPFNFPNAVRNSPEYEEALFKAFSVTLDALRELHESKGEKVDDFTFTKRKLEATC